MEFRTKLGWGVVGIIIFAVTLTFLMTTPKGECKESIHILKGVNGITDQDSGLFSSGDTSRTSLLMDNGRIISVRYRMDDLYLGKPITIKECRSLIGTEILEIDQLNT